MGQPFVDMKVETAIQPEQSEVHILDLGNIQTYWPQIVGLLKSLPHTWRIYTVDSLHNRILAGDIQVWVVGKEDIRQVVFTQIANYPATRILEIIWGAGTGFIEEAIPALDATLERFAALQECDEIAIIGRRGWVKPLRKLGFSETSVVLSRPVTRRMQ